MTRFHIGRDGEPKPCSAEDEASCPLGGTHYDSMDEAYDSDDYKNRNGVADAPTSMLKNGSGNHVGDGFTPAWLDHVGEKVEDWRGRMDVDADGNSIDWDWVKSLDYANGIGAASDAALEPFGEGDPVELLQRDLDTRARLESVIEASRDTFLTDPSIPDYDLPRAMAYANRRLNTEIDRLYKRGEDEGRWRVTDVTDFTGAGHYTVLESLNGDDVASIQDPSNDIIHRRKERRGERDGNGNRVIPYRYNPMYTRNYNTMSLPGQDVGTVVGIDLETTGLDPNRTYIIDTGYEYMDMQGGAGDHDNGSQDGYAYEQDYYSSNGAYGQERFGSAVPQRETKNPKPYIKTLTGIDTEQRGETGDDLAFDDNPRRMQHLLGVLKSHPYVAHNARFEHGFFMQNIPGYAEAYRNGEIRIIDTMMMSREWDHSWESLPEDRITRTNPDGTTVRKSPNGFNTLQSYSRRMGALPEDRNERHLGLEDAHIMLDAMRTHLNHLRARDAGPWDRNRPITGTGGIRWTRR